MYMLGTVLDLRLFLFMALRLLDFIRTGITEHLFFKAILATICLLRAPMVSKEVTSARTKKGGRQSTRIDEHHGPDTWNLGLIRCNNEACNCHAGHAPETRLHIWAVKPPYDDSLSNRNTTPAS